MALKIEVHAAYDESPDSVFARARAFDDLQTALSAIATYTGLAPGAIAQTGETHVVDIRFWRVFPVTAHTIQIVRVDPDARVIESRESHRGIRRWDHVIEVRPGEDGGAIWSDQLTIDAGWQTPMVARFCAYVYRHGHRKRGGSAIRTLVLRH